MSSLLEQASLVVTPNGTKASKLYSVKPTDGSGDMTVVRATTATRVNSSGLIESSAINVPRLDYTGSSCPSLLVEPQRTNIILRSQELDNAIWTKSSGTMTANATVSPDGTTTAEEWSPIAGAGFHDFYQAFTGGAITTSSIYVKKNTAQFVYLSLNQQATGTDWATGVYDLDNLTTSTFQSGGVTSPIATIQNVGNGWRRITLTASTTATLLYSTYGIANSLSPTFSARGRIGFETTATFYAWGAQSESGANATSYIPTTTASVTRNADFISKTGISSLIGQTEGTLYANINFKNWEASNRVLAIGDGTTNNRIVILEGSVANTFRFLITTGGVLQSDILSSSFPIGNYKIAAAYKNNDVALYINGSQIGTDNLATIPVCSNLYLGIPEYSGIPTAFFLNDSIKSAALWKTRLSNTELASLTTI